jgi:hypothetical protein
VVVTTLTAAVVAVAGKPETKLKNLLPVFETGSFFI